MAAIAGQPVPEALSLEQGDDSALPAFLARQPDAILA
ncbi:hypothetical protein PSYPI_48565, partial [Pseudomonas syringae pv. pisi str. 1704B]